jgi:thiol:disulfide interchange protein DsbG
MHEANIHGTPGLFYKDTAGHVRRRDGMPKLSELPAITGMPAQPEPDPSLVRFSKSVTESKASGSGRGDP